MTIVVSSHLLNELEQFADGFILLHKGSIALDISKEDLLKFKKKVSFTFDTEPGDIAISYLTERGEYHRNKRVADMELEPGEIVQTVERLVKMGAIPVNVETQNLLESKYLEITA